MTHEGHQSRRRQQKKAPERFGFGLNSPVMLQPHAVVSVPEILAAMPPPLMPTEADYRMVNVIEATSLRSSGVEKGVYSDWAFVEAHLILMHDTLLEEMKRQAAEFGQRQLVYSLYDQLERLYGYLNASQALLEVQALVNGSRDAPMLAAYRWAGATNTLTGIKYLVELAAQTGRRSPQAPDSHALRRLLALAARFVELDMFMEAVYHGLGIYEVEISDGPKAIIRTSSRGLDARRKWLAASQRSLFVAARTRAREQDRAASRPISKADVLAGPELQALDTAMKQELDYGLGDVMDLAAGTITLIEERPRWIMSMPKTLFIQRLESASGLTPEVLRSMLAARTMTKAQDDAFDPKQILPIERYWRPSRLISRPFVEVEGADETEFIVGVEVATGSFRVWFDRLLNGHDKIPGSRPGGPIEKVIGRIQEKTGNPFRDELAAACNEVGCLASTEELPPGMSKSEVGPIDVFVIDKAHKRFLLVECKTVDIARTPRELASQRQQFIGSETREGPHKPPFLRTLQKKHVAFVEKSSELMGKYGLVGTKPFHIESVIVGGHPMEWVYLEPPGTPILDDNEFFDRLKAGHPMVQ